MIQHAAPTPIAQRLPALDAARGLALLGILLVNIDFFSMPVGQALDVTPVNDHAPHDRALFYLTHVFCEGKFYGLFALLFGAGFALQRQRLLQTRRLVPVYLRRILFLAALGVVHALGLWFGDILFPYALAALLLLALGSLRPRTLVIIAAGIFLFVALFTAAMALLTPVEQSAMRGVPAAALASPSEPAEERPFLQLVEHWKQGRAHLFTDPEWARLETRAYRHGPFLDLFLFRLITWILMLVFMLVGYGWTILAMFCLGAALLKAGAFEPGGERLHRRLLLLALFVGLPLVAAAYTLVAVEMTPATLALYSLLHILGAPLMSLGYLSAVTLLVRSGRARRALGAFAATGRLALTNYLMQSALATTLFLYYGLGLYADTTRTQRFAIALSLYALQVAFSVVYLRRFRHGPVEWLWRRATYGRTPATTPDDARR